MNEFIFRDKNDYSSILLNNQYNTLQMDSNIDTLFSCMIDYVSLLDNDKYNQCLTYIHEQRTIKIQQQRDLKIQQIINEAQKKLDELDANLIVTISTKLQPLDEQPDEEPEEKLQPLAEQPNEQPLAEQPLAEQPLAEQPDTDEDTDTDEARELTNDELIKWFECGDEPLLQKRIWYNEPLYEKYRKLKDVMNIINGNTDTESIDFFEYKNQHITPPNENIEIDITDSFLCVDCKHTCEYHPRGKNIDTRIICNNKQCPSNKKILKGRNNSSITNKKINNNVPIHIQQEIKNFKKKISHILEYVTNNNLENIDDGMLDIIKNIRNIARRNISKKCKNLKVEMDDIPYIIRRILPYYLIEYTNIKFTHLGNIDKHFTIKNNRVYYLDSILDNKPARTYIKFLIENDMFKDYSVGSFGRDMITFVRVVMDWDDDFYKQVKNINIGELIYKSI